jgi:hypothetical protein
VVIRRCSSGSRKAAVLPEPVGDRASTSRPCSAAGNTWTCTGVGCTQPADAAAAASAGSRPKAAKVSTALLSAAGARALAERKRGVVEGGAQAEHPGPGQCTALPVAAYATLGMLEGWLLHDALRLDAR